MAVTTEMPGSVGMQVDEVAPAGRGGALKAHETAAQLQQSLQRLLVLIGQSLRSRTQLQQVLQSTRAKAMPAAPTAPTAALSMPYDAEKQASTSTSESSAVSSNALSTDERALLQHYDQRGTRDYVPNLKALEQECMRYNHAVHQLTLDIARAKRRLEMELPKARAREEEERKATEAAAAARAQEEQARQQQQQQQQQQQEEANRLQQQQEASQSAGRELKLEQDGERSQQANAAPPSESGATDTGPDDDDSDDDEPLAGRPPAPSSDVKHESTGSAIDLTDDSPSRAAAPQLPANRSAASGINAAPALDAKTADSTAATDPATLLTSLTGIPTSSDTKTDPSGDANAFISNAASQAGMPSFEGIDLSSLGLSNFSTSSVDGDEVGGSMGSSSANDALGAFYNTSSSDNAFDLGSGVADADGDGMLNFNLDQFDGLDMSFLNNLGDNSGGGAGAG